MMREAIPGDESALENGLKTGACGFVSRLAEIRKTGMTSAIKFSASAAAIRAYRAIGFEQVGTYVITLFSAKD